MQNLEPALSFRFGCKDTTAPRGHEGGGTERGGTERRHEGGHDGGAERWQRQGHREGTKREGAERGGEAMRHGRGRRKEGTKEGQRERAATWGHREGHRGEHRKGARRGARRGSSERGAQRGQAEKTAHIERFWGGQTPFSGQVHFYAGLWASFCLSLFFFFSAQGGREHIFSMCFVDGSDRHPRKIHDDSNIYFVLSVCFVDHGSLGPIHTNAKFLHASHVYFVLSLCFVDRCSLEKKKHPSGGKDNNL